MIIIYHTIVYHRIEMFSLFSRPQLVTFYARGGQTTAR